MAGELAVLIGRNIRVARIEAGLNQRQLAQLIDDPAASNMHVSEWERGVRKPSDRYMPLIAQALDRSVDWFYRDHEQAPAPNISTPDLSNGASDADQLARIEQLLKELLDRVQRLEQTQTTEPPEPQTVEEFLNEMRRYVRTVEQMTGRLGQSIAKRELQSRRAEDHRQTLRQAAG